jgi:hypothetical protein
MKLITCIDDRRGMSFGRRRQSRDRRVCEDIVRDLGEATLYISPYSRILFEDFTGAAIEEAADPIAAANGKANAAVFLENQAAPSDLSAVDAVVLYLWGRTYPADRYFDADLSAFRLKSRVTFVGNSHDHITKETYVK